MKNLFAILTAMIVFGIATANAETLREKFNGNTELNVLFLNPAGVSVDIDTADNAVLTKELNEKQIPFKHMNLGIYGNLFVLPENKLAINGVNIGKSMLIVDNNYSGIMYISEPSDNYEDMYAHLTKELSKLAVSDTSEKFDSADIEIYMITEKYGIGIAKDPKNKTAIAMLMDMKNLEAFMQMGIQK